ncbi:hypothetical protein PGTUg99_024284 [Puccinia graminis f. sp. tritici]|uniref:Uncharacterized protein n=1 Tax=Puccinia graminis f. sp. tritici TaxID=56615 RepID=A0A5B0Q411_PUCGR|nr:hypothetical protein PGTUg99_024284 [Puccinia graminis f. sp. tritici]
MSARTDVTRRVLVCATTGLLNSSDKVCPKTRRTGLSDDRLCLTLPFTIKGLPHRIVVTAHSRLCLTLLFTIKGLPHRIVVTAHSRLCLTLLFTIKDFIVL